MGFSYLIKHPDVEPTKFGYIQKFLVEIENVINENPSQEDLININVTALNLASESLSIEFCSKLSPLSLRQFFVTRNFVACSKKIPSL